MSTLESLDSVEIMIKSLMKDPSPSMKERIDVLQSLWDISTLTVPEALLLLHLLKEQKLQSLQELYHNPFLFRWLCDPLRDAFNMKMVGNVQQDDQFDFNRAEEVQFVCDSSIESQNKSDLESLQSKGLITLAAVPRPKRPASTDSDEVRFENQSIQSEDQVQQIRMELEDEDQCFRRLSIDSRHQRIIKPLPIRHQTTLPTSFMSKSKSSDSFDSDEVSDTGSSNLVDQPSQLAIEYKKLV
ncbi:hypothetical protein DFH28DRAFT_1102979 [Melampsora americana]|nr:hypothetical protein DFH28DRAFT_1102979 [Melampsora americana]